MAFAVGSSSSSKLRFSQGPTPTLPKARLVKARNAVPVEAVTSGSSEPVLNIIPKSQVGAQMAGPGANSAAFRHLKTNANFTRMRAETLGLHHDATATKTLQLANCLLVHQPALGWHLEKTGCWCFTALAHQVLCYHFYTGK